MYFVRGKFLSLFVLLLDIYGYFCVNVFPKAFKKYEVLAGSHQSQKPVEKKSDTKADKPNGMHVVYWMWMSCFAHNCNKAGLAF